LALRPTAARFLIGLEFFTLTMALSQGTIYNTIFTPVSSRISI
jgi:hypothetical protein